MFTKETYSKKREISKHDIISILKTLGIIAMPVLAYIQIQLANGDVINRSIALAGLIGAGLKILEKFITDYDAKLG